MAAALPITPKIPIPTYIIKSLWDFINLTELKLRLKEKVGDKIKRINDTFKYSVDFNEEKGFVSFILYLHSGTLFTRFANLSFNCRKMEPFKFYTHGDNIITAVPEVVFIGDYKDLTVKFSFSAADKVKLLNKDFYYPITLDPTYSTIITDNIEFILRDLGRLIKNIIIKNPDEYDVPDDSDDPVDRVVLDDIDEPDEYTEKIIDFWNVVDPKKLHLYFIKNYKAGLKRIDDKLSYDVNLTEKGFYFNIFEIKYGKYYKVAHITFHSNIGLSNQFHLKIDTAGPKIDINIIPQLAYTETGYFNYMFFSYGSEEEVYIVSEIEKIIKFFEKILTTIIQSGYVFVDQAVFARGLPSFNKYYYKYMKYKQKYINLKKSMKI